MNNPFARHQEPHITPARKLTIKIAVHPKVVSDLGFNRFAWEAWGRYCGPDTELDLDLQITEGDA